MQFGGKVTKSDLEKYSRSGNWDGKKFVNLEETKLNVNLLTMPKILYKQFFERKGREPLQKLPIIPLEKEQLLSPSAKAKFIWYGHSVLLMRINNKTLLIDPMLGPNAAPIAPFAVRRFSENTLDLIDDFPEIDLLLLSHDHYDHLDLHSIQKLKPRVKKYFVAMGVARHLVRWGIPEEDITEFDWWQEQVVDDIQIRFTVSRHFSGRGLTDRAKSLWGGWIFKTAKENIWFSGDGGYGNHFSEIGKKWGPFDFAFMECGQYNPNWHQIHMYPEESVQAAIDASVNRIMPVHWAGFSLAQHTWTDPVERFVAESTKRGIPFLIPELGQLISLGDQPETSYWWK